MVLRAAAPSMMVRVIACAIALFVAACTPTQTAETTTTTEAATTTTTAIPAIPDGMETFADHVTGLTGIRPAGWKPTPNYGAYTEPTEDQVGVFLTAYSHGANAGGVLDVWGDIIGGLPITEAGTVTTDRIDFTVHEFESAAGVFEGTYVVGRLALGEVEGGVYSVAVIGDPEVTVNRYDTMLAPALEALAPIGTAEAGLGGADQEGIVGDTSALPEERAAALVPLLSLREKLGQMTLIEKDSLPPGAVEVYALGGVLSGGGGSPDDNTPEGWADMVDGFQEEALATRLGIPMIYGVDAIHGHGNLAGATLFPHNIGLGASNDADLVYRIGRATAAETAATGIRWNYGPVLAVSDDIRWGRTYEAYSQDVQRVNLLGGAYQAGLHGDDLTAPDSVLATAKHYIGDGSTVWGTSTTDDYLIDQGVAPDDADLLDELLIPYRTAIDAGAWSVMGSFSSWGDTKVHADADLLTDTLRTELGFNGFVVSDWAAIDQIDPDYAHSVTTAINAGIDMNMVPYDPATFMWVLGNAVNAGKVSMERIDEAVERILTTKFAMGLFDAPYADRSLIPSVGSDAHRMLARDAVAGSAVLLTNDGTLPISPDTATILVTGNAADDPGIQAGGWTLTWQGRPGNVPGATSILEALTERVGDDTTIIHSPTGRLRGQWEDIEPDLCLVALGEEPYAEGKGDDPDLALPNAAIFDRIEGLCASTVVVLVTGRPVIITDHVDDWNATVAAWWFGSEADGLIDVLVGDKPFTATLPVDWPATVEDLPASTTTAEPLFPIGHGITD